MIFFFAGLALILYYKLNKEKRVTYLFILSWMFYFWLCKRMALVIVLDTIWNYWLAGRMRKMPENSERRKPLVLGIITNVLVLCLFKYPANIWTLAGISYISFKMISYLIDVYRGEEIQDTYILYCLYILFFPQVLAGPIERPQYLIRQFVKGIEINKGLILEGIDKVILGIFQKVVIANRLSGYVAYAFANPSNSNGMVLWLGALFYSVQIYCDFAGYSNISIGVSNVLGIRVNDNFNLPYFSQNINEFWRRWHISLSSWLRDYIYIPLGGNRVSNFRKKLIY